MLARRPESPRYGLTFLKQLKDRFFSNKINITPWHFAHHLLQCPVVPLPAVFSPDPGWHFLSLGTHHPARSPCKHKHIPAISWAKCCLSFLAYCELTANTKLEGENTFLGCDCAQKVDSHPDFSLTLCSAFFDGLSVNASPPLLLSANPRIRYYRSLSNTRCRLKRYLLLASASHCLCSPRLHSVSFLAFSKAFKQWFLAFTSFCNPSSSALSKLQWLFFY